MKKIFISFALLIPTASTLAKPYGRAGCGLGSIIMGKDGNQILAATSNASSVSQLFGISSGTSNCVDSSRQLSLIPYVETNKEQLLTDIARGAGESITGLAQLMGCSDIARLGSILQGQLPSPQTTNLSEHIYTVVKANAGDSCAIYTTDTNHG